MKLFTTRRPPLRPILTGALAIAACLALAGSAGAALPVYGFVVKNTYPHDPQAFTQGLLFDGGFVYESTGLNGRSSVRKVELESGKVLMKTDLAEKFFGEGITLVGSEIVGLTWQSELGYTLDIRTFRPKRQFSYKGEGWGLAHHGKHVYLSDGTPTIRVLDAATLAEVRRLQVSADGKPLAHLNELEWVEGELYANVWQTDMIARIDPHSGRVTGWIDLTGLLEPRWRGDGPVDVLNGIAWDSKGRRLFVTGKLWPKLFEIGLVRRSQ